MEGQSQLAPQQVSHLNLEQELGQAITDVDIKAVISIFGQITDYGRLDRVVTWRICQSLHESLRREKRQNTVQVRRENVEEMVAFAELLVKRIKKGELAPDHRAHVHLLAFFKESGALDAGVTFWQWLELQDESFVNNDVYGSAIELLAVNGAPLVELEEMYQNALERFPGHFNAYHLAPNAILANRDERTIIKGIPTVLLQGIMTARLLRGASRDAYLALDTTARLYPTLIPGRFFGLFIDERPLAEAYTIFAMACRAGIVLPYEHARKLLTAVRTGSEPTSSLARIARLRQMLSVAYMYVGEGGFVTTNLVSELVIALTQVLRLHGVASLESKDRKQIVDGVMDIIRKMLEFFLRYGGKPGLSAFNSIITNLAGFGRSKHIIGIALRDAHALGLEPNHVTRRSILTAAGNIGDAHLVATAWNELVVGKAKSGQNPDATDYHILVKAAKSCGANEFAQEACVAAVDQLTETERESIYERLYSTYDEQAASTTVALDASALLEGLETLRADLAVIEERTKDGAGVQDFNEQTLPMMLLPLPDEQRLPEIEVRKLYDEVTTEQQPAASEQPQPSVAQGVDDRPSISETSIPLGTLRYENWKTINYLLALAENHDKAYDKAVDEAIAAGVAPPPREKVLKATAGHDPVSIGLSDVAYGPVSASSDEDVDDEQIRKARGEILRLRGISSADI
ncbi:hypothetical protein LTR36_003700 [Oleoguttula mirabilis]|uniref:Uncharacterized protein n=1 Tax=Oleoguttula mirabilis TaxID=1507867 RepID=A0AAV9JIQ6_9PEZI|nr:hypothetical protein LTR36_003700 [Oleoguttula mirabilis]